MRFVKSICFGLALLSSSAAFAGVGSSGGGKGVVCRLSSGEIQSVETLDIWEARNVFGRTIHDSPSDLSAALEIGFDQLATAFHADGIMVVNGRRQTPKEFNRAVLSKTTTWLQEIDSPQVHHLRNISLELTDDSYEAISPSKCAIEQIIRFSDYASGSHEAFINQDLFERLDSINQAALLLHEAVYLKLRLAGEPTSLRVRRAIGIAFSRDSFESADAALPERIYQCLGGGIGGKDELIVYVNPESIENQEVALQILKFHGRAAVDLVPSTMSLSSTISDFFSEPEKYHVDWGPRTAPDFAFEISVTPRLHDRRKYLELKLLAAPGERPSPASKLICSLREKSDIFQMGRTIRLAYRHRASLKNAGF